MRIHYLIEELRDSLPFVRGRDWNNTAALMNEAANELERLALQVSDLEKSLKHTKRESVVPVKEGSLFSRLFR
jgi:hypothetical protein